MKQIKRILFSILSEKRYLRLLHRGFYLMLDLGLLKGNTKFKYHYKVKDIIKKKDVVLDIGANLGYFAKTFSRLASKGKVICIEPLPQYFDVLNYFIGTKSNVKIHNVALGKDPGIVTMVLPMQDGMIRTGLPHITNKTTSERIQDVNIVNPISLIKNEDAIDYIKCDVEGYEWVIFQELLPAIKKHHPIIQIEIAQENLNAFLTFFTELDYIQYGISKNTFIKEITGQKQQEEGDYLFIPKSKEASFLKHIK